MKTSQLVSDFRAMYALHANESKWSDRYLISLFNIARSKILYDSNKRERIKKTNFIGFCMPLCLGKPIECPCIAEAMCYALVSKYNVPDYIPLVFPYKGIEVRDADGNMLDEWHPRYAKLTKLNPALKNKNGYWLENYKGETKLVIWNTLDLEYVYITLLATNLDDISAIPSCGDDSDDNCGIDWTEEEFPLDSNLIYDLYRLVDSMLVKNLRDVDDDVNDTNDNLTKE